MKNSNQYNSQKSKSQNEDKWLLFREERYSPIIDHTWPIQRQEVYGPIIDELQEILEEGFEPSLGRLLRIFLCKVFNHAAPRQYHKILLGSILISLLACILLILFSSLTFIDFTKFTNIYLIFLVLITILIYLPLISLDSILLLFSDKKSKEEKREKYIQKLRKGIFFRNKMPLEEDFLPSFNEHLIEYKIKNLSLFKEEDLKVVENFFERQEKISIKNKHYANKILATVASFVIILIPNLVVRTSFLTLFTGFFYSFEYFIQKDSITSRSFVCVQILKEAQIRRSKSIKLRNQR